jgi:hypothetical protein
LQIQLAYVRKFPHQYFAAKVAQRNIAPSQAKTTVMPPEKGSRQIQRLARGEMISGRDINERDID